MMFKHNIIKRCEIFEAMNAKAKDILKEELLKREQYYLSVTDFSYVHKKEQGYIAHYFDKDGNNPVVITVSFTWENTPDPDNPKELLISWNPDQSIIVVR